MQKSFTVLGVPNPREENYPARKKVYKIFIIQVSKQIEITVTFIERIFVIN